MNASGVVIRPPLPRDARRLAEVHIAAWQATYRGVMSDEFLDGMDVERRTDGWQRGIAEPREGIVCLLAEVGGEVAGFAIVGPPEGDADPGTGQLYAINLHPDSWGQGTGSVLFAAAERQLVDLGYERAFLWVEQSNSRGVRFYSNRGWKHDGGTLEDTTFDPPISERRHSRTFPDTMGDR